MNNIYAFDKIASKNQWGQVIPFENNNTSNFPTNAIPTINNFLEELSTFTQTDVALASTIVLPVLSNCLQKKFKVNVSVTKKASEKGFLEQLSLFSMAVLGSGERKSPVFKVLVDPLRQYQFDYNLKIEKDVKIFNHKVELLKEQIKAQRKIISASNSKNKELARDEYNRLIEEEVNLVPIKFKSLVENDITLERTASLMHENEGKLGIFSDEGGVIKTWSGKYDSNDIEVILSAYSGTTFSVRRQTRDEFIIKEPALSVAIATQEGTLSEMLDNEHFKDKGLNARFLFSKPKSMVGDREIITEPISKKQNDLYINTINRLLNLKHDNEIINFTDEAHQELIKYRQQHENNLKESLKDMREWASKYIGNLVRICGILHIIKNLDALENEEVPFIPAISLETFKEAKKVSEYFLDNAKKIFLTTERCKEYKDAQYVLDKIKQNFKGGVINKRDLFQKCRGAFAKTNDINPVLNELIERNYIAVEPEHENNLKYIIINPEIY